MPSKAGNIILVPHYHQQLVPSSFLSSSSSLPLKERKDILANGYRTAHLIRWEWLCYWRRGFPDGFVLFGMIQKGTQCARKMRVWVHTWAWDHRWYVLHFWIALSRSPSGTPSFNISSQVMHYKISNTLIMTGEPKHPASGFLGAG